MSKTYGDAIDLFGKISATANTLSRSALLEVGFKAFDRDTPINPGCIADQGTLASIRADMERLQSDFQALEALLEPDTTEAAA